MCSGTYDASFFFECYNHKKAPRHRLPNCHFRNDSSFDVLIKHRFCGVFVVVGDLVSRSSKKGFSIMLQVNMCSSFVNYL